MPRRSIAGVVGLFVLAAVVSGADTEVVGTIVKVDAVKKTIAVKTAKGVKEFGYAANLKVLDPADKAIKDGLKNKRFAPGAEVELTIPDKGTLVSEIQLAPPQAPKDGKPPKAAPKKEIKGGIHATVNKVDVAKKSFTATTEDGKVLLLAVTDETKIIGPRGGQSDDGIEDDRFVADAEVIIVLAPGGKSAAEVHLPYRKRTPREEPKDKNAKPKTIPKDKDK